MADPLRLKVSSDEDLQVLSALLQDAIIPGEDMVYARADQRFILVANRFCGDQPTEDGLVGESGEPVFQRQHYSSKPIRFWFYFLSLFRR